ncbi:MAG: acyltransferase [Candidatus Limnocylindria bacterium]
MALPRDARREESRSAPDAEPALAFTSYLRVLAIAAVVAIHTFGRMVLNQEIRGTPTWWAATAIDLGSSWAVPLFVMVSGALVLAPDPGGVADGRRGSLGAFYRRRLRRIVVPLVVAHVLYLVLRATALHEDLTLPLVVRNLLDTRVYVQLYFFWIILGLYLVAPVLRSFVETHPRRDVLLFGAGVVIWMWLVVAGAGLLNQVGGSGAPWTPSLLTIFLPYIGYFLLGYALREVVLSRRALVAAGAVFLAADALVVAVYAARPGPPVSVLLGGGYWGLPVAATAVSIFLIGRSVVHPGSRLAAPRLAKPMRRLGDLTLGVFVVHLAVLLAAQALPVFADNVTYRSVAHSGLLYLLVLVSSFALCAAIARVPLLRRSIGL